MASSKSKANENGKTSKVLCICNKDGKFFREHGVWIGSVNDETKCFPGCKLFSDLKKQQSNYDKGKRSRRTESIKIWPTAVKRKTTKSSIVMTCASCGKRHQLVGRDLTLRSSVWTFQFFDHVARETLFCILSDGRSNYKFWRDGDEYCSEMKFNNPKDDIGPRRSSNTSSLTRFDRDSTPTPRRAAELTSRTDKEGGVANIQSPTSHAVRSDPEIHQNVGKTPSSAIVPRFSQSGSLSRILQLPTSAEDLATPKTQEKTNGKGGYRAPTSSFAKKASADKKRAADTIIERESKIARSTSPTSGNDEDIPYEKPFPPSPLTRKNQLLFPKRNLTAVVRDGRPQAPVAVMVPPIQVENAATSTTNAIIIEDDKESDTDGETFITKASQPQPEPTPALEALETELTNAVSLTNDILSKSQEGQVDPQVPLQSLRRRTRNIASLIDDEPSEAPATSSPNPARSPVDGISWAGDSYYRSPTPQEFSSRVTDIAISLPANPRMVISDNISSILVELEVQSHPIMTADMLLEPHDNIQSVLDKVSCFVKFRDEEAVQMEFKVSDEVIAIHKDVSTELSLQNLRAKFQISEERDTETAVKAVVRVKRLGNKEMP